MCGCLLPCSGQHQKTHIHVSSQNWNTRLKKDRVEVLQIHSMFIDVVMLAVVLVIEDEQVILVEFYDELVMH